MYESLRVGREKGLFVIIKLRGCETSLDLVAGGGDNGPKYQSWFQKKSYVKQCDQLLMCEALRDR